VGVTDEEVGHDYALYRIHHIRSDFAMMATLQLGSMDSSLACSPFFQSFRDKQNRYTRIQCRSYQCVPIRLRDEWACKSTG
jgi:hypothetical protein